MNESATAQKLFDEGHACSQSMLAAFAHRYNMPQELALKLSSSFGGGMGHQGMICGAVTGALMVLGLDSGRVHQDDDVSREKNDILVQKFFSRFLEKHNTLICNELTGVVMANPEARALGKEDGSFQNVCPAVVGFAADLVCELLEIDAK